MLNQFHDTISGTATPDATDDALARYQEVLDSASIQLNHTLKFITSKINTQGQGIPWSSCSTLFPGSEPIR